MKSMKSAFCSPSAVAPREEPGYLTRLPSGLSVALVGLLLSVPAVAGCISDCTEEYQSAIEECHVLYDDPDDADELKNCNDEAKDAYDECEEHCKS